jgi:Mn2+/Fe2+ NRAMP family transporter
LAAEGYLSQMIGIPRRYSHFVYGIIQSGLTSAVAAAVASAPFYKEGIFWSYWLQASLLAWFVMLPVVLFAAPAIRRLTEMLTLKD